MDIFSPVSAQEVDATSTPTIPFTPPGGTPQVSATTLPTGPNISLRSEIQALVVGDKAKVQIIIDTKTQEIREFNIYVIFDPRFVRVLDADSTTADIQIKYLETIFPVKTNTASQQNGIINIAGAKTDGTASIDSRVVAEFEVEGLAAGLTEIKISKENSLLINSNSLDILQATNSINLVVQESTVVITPTQTINITTTPNQTTPRTGILDEISGPQSLFFGLVLIITGIYLFRFRRHAKKISGHEG